MCFELEPQDYTGAPSKVHIVKLVKVQPEERLATTSVLNPAHSLVTDCCEARGMRYQAAIRKVKVISPEILMILEADVVCVTEGSIHTTISPNLRSWNIAGSTGTWQGDVSPAGSQTAAWYHSENMGTRETQSVLLRKSGVCDVKPINGKIPQMTYWESDQFIVPLKQGNACGGKGLTGVRWTTGTHLPHQEVGCK